MQGQVQVQLPGFVHMYVPELLNSETTVMHAYELGKMLPRLPRLFRPGYG